MDINCNVGCASASKKDQLYHQLSSGIDNKEERIIGGSFVSCCVVYF